MVHARRESSEKRLPLGSVLRRDELGDGGAPLLDDGREGIAVNRVDRRLEAGRHAHLPALRIRVVRDAAIRIERLDEALHVRRKGIGDSVDVLDHVHASGPKVGQ
jgi:hypothetical protein